jgi:hypothetical protein
MNEGNHKFALGTDSYTLGDVIFTVMLARLASDTKFFKKEVLGNPVIANYWNMV